MKCLPSGFPCSIKGLMVYGIWYVAFRVFMLWALIAGRKVRNSDPKASISSPLKDSGRGAQEPSGDCNGSLH